ncbi:hypothetical protein TUM19329_23990 [Legionella antarctica]|uniref:Uncharacterized protein n=1 Tax=Legionella antarctica TaxID=2708020 RepID=A0A6F8T6K3_9GAMM|nr:hypothetical protein [Legionella antarctica]BCA96038.1 hypothetical protein TUM19329_23990 [Legionella antarctica]
MDRMYLPSLYSSIDRVRKKSMSYIAKKEYFNSTILNIIDVLNRGVYQEDCFSALYQRHTIPPGMNLTFYESSTLVGNFWQNYIQPISLLQAKLHAAKK